MNGDGARAVWRTGFATLIFGVIGTGLGALPALRAGGISVWAFPVAALTMAGLGAGTGAALGAELDHPFRLAVAGGAAGAAAGTGVAVAGAGLAWVAAAAVLLAVGLATVAVRLRGR